MAETSEITPEMVAFIRRLPAIATQMTSIASQISSSVSIFNEGRAAILTGIEGVSDRTVSALDSIRASVGELPTMIAEAVAPVREELIKIRAEIMDRIDRLQGTVDLVREDSRVNWATANTAFNRNLSNRDDMDSVLQTIAAMERR